MNYSNTTAEICPTDSNFDHLLHVSNIIWQVFGFLSVLIGLPGHFFQILIILRKTYRKDPTSLYFVAIAICESIFLLGIFWLWCKNSALIKSDPREVLSCGIFYSILMGSTTLSNLYLASMSIDRSVMILYPARYRVLVTQSRILLRLICICLIVTVLLIPHHFYLYYEPRVTLFLCDFHPLVSGRQVLLWSLIHSIFFVSVPSLIVCISALILLRNRCEHNRLYKQTLSQSARRMHKLSIFIFIISLGICFALLPTCILEICLVHDRLSTHYRHCSSRWKVYQILLHCFLILTSINYSAKFYIHLMMSTEFRKSFIQLITCKSSNNAVRLPKSSKEQHSLPMINQNPVRKTDM